MNTILKLREKRHQVWNEAKAFLESRRTDAGFVTAEDTAAYEKMEQEVVDLGHEIDRLERQRDLDAKLNDATSKPALRNPEMSLRPQTGVGSDTYQRDFWSMMRLKNAPITNALQVGTDSEGGYLVPDEFERTLIEALDEENILRKISKVVNSSYGEKRIPVVASKGTAAWIEEEANYEESDIAFSQVSIGAHKLGTMIKVSEELLNDSVFDLESYIASEFARRIGEKEEEAFFTGDGVGKPLGILAATGGAELGASGASATALTFDDLIELYYSLKEGYRRNAVFVLNEQTLKAIRKLKDTTGQHIWQPSVTAGLPDRLLNSPVYTSSNIPSIAADAKTVLFGDFSKYWIVDRQGRTFKRLNELYATTGQVGFLGMQRVDAKLILPEAVKVLQQKTA